MRSEVKTGSGFPRCQAGKYGRVSCLLCHPGIPRSFWKVFLSFPVLLLKPASDSKVSSTRSNSILGVEDK